MNGINQIQQIAFPKETGSIQEGAKAAGAKDDSFSNMLTDAIQGVDDGMKLSEQNVENYVAGRTDNIHDVMISMQRAQLSFQMMVEIRNKVIDAYNEINRMQI